MNFNFFINNFATFGNHIFPKTNNLHWVRKQLHASVLILQDRFRFTALQRH